MRSSTLDAIRRQIIDECKGCHGIAAVLLFEPSDTPPNHFAVSAGSDSLQPNAHFSSASLLPRWLRANASYLDLPDTTGFWDGLDLGDRDLLARLRIRECAPLVVGENLVGWLGLVVHDGDAAPASPRADQIMSRIHGWATDLQAAQLASRASNRRAAASKSNRLTLAGQMAAGVAHEVRNPLAAIRSTVQLVRDEELALEERRGLLDRVLQDVDRINRVVGDMMTLGKSKASLRQTCNVAEVVRDAVQFCSPLGKRLGQALQVETPAAVNLEADPHELRQVLINLILNACQAGDGGAVVRVSLACDETREVVISVVDSGSGMSADVLAHAFEPFYSTKVDGAGLGLVISRDIIRRHRGELVLTSTPGQGTAAVIRLPI